MATLKVKIQEDIIIENQDYSSKRTKEITSVNDILKRIVSVPANVDVSLVVFQDNVGTNSYPNIDVDLLKYMRITNLHASTDINLAVIGDTANFQIVLQAGHSFMLSKADDGIAVEGATDTSPASSGFQEINRIEVDSGSSAVNVEVFVASA